ncbi:hypothetical protein [Roseovarius sp. A-2]|uniref:hypothetical protein n=1 Tax=Roseovarius sp. A-2 TaxID=1570360 RepID=UPI00111B5A1B|nr:hypothetical protein [Roseovarius sp. A-2]
MVDMIMKSINQLAVVAVTKLPNQPRSRKVHLFVFGQGRVASASLFLRRAQRPEFTAYRNLRASLITHCPAIQEEDP